MEQELEQEMESGMDEFQLEQQRRKEEMISLLKQTGQFQRTMKHFKKEANKRRSAERVARESSKYHSYQENPVEELKMPPAEHKWVYIEEEVQEDIKEELTGTINSGWYL